MKNTSLIIQFKTDIYKVSSTCIKLSYSLHVNGADNNTSTLGHSYHMETANLLQCISNKCK
jgi:azurin